MHLVREVAPAIENSDIREALSYQQPPLNLFLDDVRPLRRCDKLIVDPQQTIDSVQECGTAT